MKRLLFCLLVLTSVGLVWIVSIWKSDKEQAESYIWIYNGGFYLHDVIGFSDTLTGLYNIVGDDSVYDGNTLVAILNSGSSTELVVSNPNGNEKGYYSPLVSMERHIEGHKKMLSTNIELNKTAINTELSGIVTTKHWMENGNLQVVLDSNYSDFPNCFLDHSMDSLEVGDSMYKLKGENVCHIFKKDGLEILVRFIDPADTTLHP